MTFNLNEAVKNYRRYRGNDGRELLKEEKPEIWNKRMKYLGEIDGLSYRAIKDYNTWLFDYLFEEVIE